MKTKKVMDILNRFRGDDISEEKAVDLLENCEPFALYSAVLKMHGEGYDINKGDLPKISKLYSKLYQDDSSQLMEGLEKNHPIRLMISEHKKMEILLNKLNSILDSVDHESGDRSNVEEVIQDEGKLKDIEIIIAAMNRFKEHMLQEEELIFPIWDQKGKIGDSIILEDEHEAMREDLEDLPSTSMKRSIDWKKKSWQDLKEKVDELSGKARFHTFHEEDMFYPIVVNDLDDDDLQELKGKIDETKEEPTLGDYLDYLG